MWYNRLNAILPTTLEPRLRRCYRWLVKAFGKTGSSTAPGPGAIAEGSKPATFAQTLWRFCSNPRVRGAALIEPLHEAIRREAGDPDVGVLLAVHDWSTLSFGGHPSKADRATLTHAHDLGYDQATVLMVRGRDGAPIAPALVEMTTAAGVLTTRDRPPPADMPHIDRVLPAMRTVRDLGFGPAIVHVIDREADSVDHWRRWSADGHTALVRADDRKVLHHGTETSLVAIAEAMRSDDMLKEAGAASYHGRAARLFVAEADVILHRPGTRHAGGKQQAIPGVPLPLRLVVAEVRDLKGRVLARWLLLTNAQAELADAATVTRWYYFRWRIETMHKALKSAGWNLEGWLQRDGERLFKKLLVAPGALAAVWALERRNDADSARFQALLMQLSGSQTKRGRPVTTTGLLAGLWVLQGALGPLARHGPEGLNAMLERHLPLFATPR